MDYANLAGTPPAWLGLAGDNNQNDSNFFGQEFDGTDYNWPTWLTVMACTTLPVGFTANIFILIRGFKHKKKRDFPFHLLLMNNCIAGTLLCSLVYPVLVHRANINGFSKNGFQVFVCKMAYCCLLWLVSVGLFNNSLVATNRALSCFPHYTISRKIRGIKGTCCFVLTIWMISLMVYMIPANIVPDWLASKLCLLRAF